jgi:polysaccharide pyruvyl transferase WcaK-like protein
MVKIVIVGGYGYSDIGDESQLTTVLMNLEKFVPEPDILVLSDNPEHTIKYHNTKTDFSLNHFLVPEVISLGSRIARITRIDIVLKMLAISLNISLIKYNRKPLFLNKEGTQLINNLRNCDILFNVGGGNLNSVFRDELYSKGLTYLLCKALKKTVILSGQTIGPFTNWFDRRFAKHVLNKVDVITLRDTTSVGILKKIGIVNPLIKETADDAILLPSKDVSQVFVQEKVDSRHPLIGMNMIGLKYLGNKKLDKAKQILAQTADHLISEMGARIVFIPMHYSSCSDDREVMRDVMALMKHSEEARLISNEYDDKTLKGIIGQMDLNIGLRYHFLVFSTTMNVPSIGIFLDQYYSIKIRGILELMELEKSALDISEISIEDILSLSRDLLSNSDAVKGKLKERTEFLANRSLFTIEYAAGVLRS